MGSKVWKILLLGGLCLALRWSDRSHHGHAQTIVANYSSQLCFSRKKSYGYQERDEAQRQAFLAQVQADSADQLVYVDEVEVDDDELRGLKIEKLWARLKHYLCKTLHQLQNFGEAINHAFRQLD